MAGFIPYRSVGGTTTGEQRPFLILGSQTITLGDAVRVIAGYAQLATATERIMGVVVGFYQKKADGSRIALGSSAAVLTNAVRSGNQGVIGSDTVVAASDNVTVDKVGVYVVIDPNMEYINTPDELGVYTGSSVIGQTQVGNYFDIVAASDQIDSTTYTQSHSAQFILMEVNPLAGDVAYQGSFKLVESQLTA